jgi:hypothetical protein
MPNDMAKRENRSEWGRDWLFVMAVENYADSRTQAVKHAQADAKGFA